MDGGVRVDLRPRGRAEAVAGARHAVRPRGRAAVGGAPVLALALLAWTVHAEGPADVAALEAQRSALARLAAFDGVWPGEATVMQSNGEQLKLTQMERANHFSSWIGAMSRERFTTTCRVRPFDALKPRHCLINLKSCAALGRNLEVQRSRSCNVVCPQFS